MDLQFMADDLARNREAAMNMISASHDVEFVAEEGRWDAAQHFEHLALFNDAYLKAMASAVDAHRSGHAQRKGRGIGIVSKVFLRWAEPPVRRWARTSTPAILTPARLPLSDSFDHFLKSHERVAEFVARSQDVDLDGTYFVNPFVKGLNFSLSTCLLLIAAHERRHLWEIPESARRG